MDCEDWVQALWTAEAVVIEEKLNWADRIGRGWEAVRDIVGKVWIYVVAGIGVGAAIHGYVPETFMACIMGKDTWRSVPAAVLVGFPCAPMLQVLIIAERCPSPTRSQPASTHFIKELTRNTLMSY